MIQSHDFASTYVGTPFYMSPEICAAEKYTLKSDIWSLGCIIYELCSREPPFNAKSHFQLVQRIKEGKIAPLPAIYSAELMSVIKDCLKVNPDRRPDTAQLLNLPVVRLMRKEKEVVEFSKVLKAKEAAMDKRIHELDHKLNSVDQDRSYMRQEIDSSLRREWEVKARLEIDRLVQAEIENLQSKFEEAVQGEVSRRLETELQRYTLKKTVSVIENQESEFSSSLAKSDYPLSSIGNSTNADGDFPSTTDITELSAYDSPEPIVVDQHQLKKKTRTPFGRAQTMFTNPPHAGTPMDIEMASPSPITIASLSLSPRRNAGAKAPVTNPSNIFTANQVITGDPRWEATRDSSGGLSDSESDDEAPMPSPTRMIKSIKNPFQNRPNLHAQKSAPIHRLQRTQTLGHLPTASNPDLLHPIGSNGALRERANSPNRRLSKIPSVNNLNGAANPNGNSSGSDSGPTRGPIKKSESEPIGLPSKVGMVPKAKGGVRGRTLVELQQARAGGRPLSAVIGGGGENSPSKRGFRSAVDPAPVWDPERDEMPSPFLCRRKNAISR
jgi:serine/threonine protein kinase